MSASAFDRCHAVTAVWEGGWSDHPADPGGATMYGITLAKYREHYPGGTAAQLRKITKAQAVEIYRKDFWVKAGCETLHPGVDLATYDASVNSGVSRGRKWLLASIGGSAVDTVKKLCKKRLGFMQALKIWKTFGKGWARRVADIEAKGVAWALAAQGVEDHVAKEKLLAEQDAAAKKAKAQTTGAVVSGGSGTATTQTDPGTVIDPSITDQVAGWVIGGIVTVALLVGAYLLLRAYINRNRAAAYAAEGAAL